MVRHQLRIKETIGITHNLLQESVTTVPDSPKDHIERRADDEAISAG